MDDLDFLAFAALFKEAYTKCFGFAPKNPMTEAESKIFCNKILDQTGLSIGWKSVKNYSLFIIGENPGRRENPSTATLDTLARYVLAAPYTSEIQRKNDESHYPYWFLYREKFSTLASPAIQKKSQKKWLLAGGAFIIVALVLICLKFIGNTSAGEFTDNFGYTSEAALQKRGWLVQQKDAGYWNRRGDVPNQLTLFTLEGDNWPDPSHKPGIRNLLLRPIPYDCFTAEVHLKNFIPDAEWQQAGLLLLEDTTFTGKSIRLSLAYNDYFGGMHRPREILIQAITALGHGFGKPEEIAHKLLFSPDSVADNSILVKNLANSALRIEKQGNKYRFLYAGGASENGAFKEVVTQEFDMKPRYIGIFALKGFTGSQVVPVAFRFFRITADPCY